MKLRNKKTGEIVEWEHGLQYKLGKEYQSVREFFEEWEDVPKESYVIDMWGDSYMVNVRFGVKLSGIEQAKECGLYFETKEEAELAVRKLKAWKRLKDKGFRFKGGDDACISYEVDWRKWGGETDIDFELLFGGEE